MTENQLRNKISRFIIISNSILYLSTIIYYFFLGFDDEELTVLIGLLTPITTVYMAAMIKYAVSNKNVMENPEKDIRVNKLYITITSWAIPAHFFILFFAISAKALVNAINFEQLKIIFTIVESLFGAYVGIIVSSLYKVPKEDREKANGDANG